MNNAQHAEQFIAKYQGQYIDEDKYYGSQCWDLVARYAREEFGCPSFNTGSGGAEGLWRIFANPIPQYFDKVSRDDLQAGDIVVWDASFYPPSGHTALVWRRDGGTVWVFEQDGSKDYNNDGKADGVAYIAQRAITSKVYGGLRPKGSNEMIGDNAHLNALFQKWFGRGPSKNDTESFVNKISYANMVEQLDTHPESKAFWAKIADALNWKKAIEKGDVIVVDKAVLADLVNWKKTGIELSEKLNDSDTAKLNTVLDSIQAVVDNAKKGTKK